MWIKWDTLWRGFRIGPGKVYALSLSLLVYDNIAITLDLSCLPFEQNRNLYLLIGKDK